MQMRHSSGSSTAWDANDDGRVFPKEIELEYRRQVEPARSRVSASVSEHGPPLFETLDTTGDKRLSVREMRTAGQRLLSLDKNGDGQLDSSELPSRIDVTFSRGTASLGPRLIAFPQNARVPKQRVAQPGPKWFSGMDRNGDGDVSLKEFLGKPEHFRKLDVNGDGFIELKEAEASEKNRN